MLKKLLLSSVVGIILTGCGSVAITDGGGVDTSGDQNSNTSSVTPSNTNNSNTNNSNTSSVTPSATDDTEHYLTFPDDGTKRYRFNNIDTTGEKAIVSPPTPIPGNNDGNPGSPKGEYAVYNQALSTYGLWINTNNPILDLNNPKTNLTFLANSSTSNSGTLTKNLPKNTVLSYSGHAVQFGAKAFKESGGDPHNFDSKTNPFYTDLIFTANVELNAEDGNSISGYIRPSNNDASVKFRSINIDPQKFSGNRANNLRAVTNGVFDNGSFKNQHEGVLSFNLIGEGNKKEIVGKIEFKPEERQFNTAFGGKLATKP